MVTFLFSVHTITEAKQYAGLGGAEPGLEPGRWIFVAPPLLSGDQYEIQLDLRRVHPILKIAKIKSKFEQFCFDNLEI